MVAYQSHKLDVVGSSPTLAPMASTLIASSWQKLDNAKIRKFIFSAFEKDYTKD